MAALNGQSFYLIYLVDDKLYTLTLLVYNVHCLTFKSTQHFTHSINLFYTIENSV
jgi:hypothetical protein